MHPAFVVDGDQPCLGKRLRRLERLLAAHRHVETPARLGCPREQHHHARRAAPRDFRRALIPDGVARHVDQVARLVDAEREADHVARIRLDADRPVARRRRRDQQAPAVARLEGRETGRIAAQPLRPGLRRVDQRHARQHGAAGMVEIVEMGVLAEQHRVERADLLDRQGRSGGLLEANRLLLAEPGRIEGRIGQQAHTVVFDQHRRAADERQGQVWRLYRGFPVRLVEEAMLGCRSMFENSQPLDNG